MDKNRPHLGKLGMKLNSRALATALPVGYLPMSRNALVMQSGCSGGVEEGGRIVGHVLPLKDCSTCVCVCVCVCACSDVHSCLTLCDPWTVACQAPLSMEPSRQEY